MPPKQSAKKQKPQLEQDEHVEYALQAVVICDDGKNNFEPLNDDIHPILFPLAGTPILAFTLEFLERGGVEDIIVVCTTHSTQIRSYLASSRWGDTRYPVKVRVVNVASAGSVGDALREIDRLGLVKADFVLIRGGVLSNLPLPSIVDEHRKRKETDKDVMLMTMVLMQTDNGSAFSYRRNLRDARLHILSESDYTVSTDHDFYRCLLSEHIEVYPERKRILHLPKGVTSQHANILFRNDLYDCNIEICTPEVPALFTENFDWEDLRRDLLNDVLTSDLLSKNIYCYIAKSGYGGNITSFEEYWRASNDMAKGLTAPFDPVMNIDNDQTFTKKGSVWREKDVKVEKSAQLTNVIIGSGTTISDGAIVTNCVIGRNCVIPAGVIVEDSVLWNNVTLNEGCKLKRSMIAADNTLQNNTHLGVGTILPPKTELQPSTLIPDNQTFTVYTSSSQKFQKDEDSDDDIEQIPLTSLNLTDSEVSEIGSDSDSEDEADQRSRHSSTSAQSGVPTNEEFYIEAEESLSRAFLENHSIENATIELKTLRMATNVTFHEVREAIVAALMNVVVMQPAKMGGALSKWGELLRNFMDDREAEVNVIFCVQRYFAKRGGEGKKGFVLGLQGLYQVDVIEEDSILKWFEDDRSSGISEKWGESMAALRKSAEKFVTWLKEAEEESDED